MSFRTLPLLTLLALALLLESSVRGEALPLGVRARLGTTRFRVGDARNCLALSPDGKVLATGGGSSVRFWNRASGEQLRWVGLPVLRIFTVQFSPNGRYFAAIGDNRSYLSRPIGIADDHSVFVGTVAEGNVLHQFRGEYDSAVFSADCKWLLVHGCGNFGQGDQPVGVWDIASGKELRGFPAVVSYALSPDGKILAGGDKDGVIHLWDVKSRAERGRLTGHHSPVYALAFSPNGRTLVSGSGEARALLQRRDDKAKKPDKSIRLWDVAAGKERQPARRQEYKVAYLCFAPDGKTFASADGSNKLYLWDAATGRLRQVFPNSSGAGGDFLFSPDGRYLIYKGTSRSLGDDWIHQWDIAAGKERRRWKASDCWMGGSLFAPDGKTLLCVRASIRAWDTTTGEEQSFGPDHRAPVRTLTFSRNGKLLATVDEHSYLRTWDTRKGVPLPDLTAERVARCAFTLDGCLLITMAGDGTVQVREVPSGRIVRRFRICSAATVRLWEQLAKWERVDLESSKSFSDACVLDRACRLLAVVDDDQCIHLWDVRRGVELRRLEGHRGLISGLVFSADGKWLFSRSTDRTVRWWDVAGGSEIQRFQGDEADSPCFSLSTDGRLLAWAAGESIHLYDLAARKEVRQWKGHAGGTTRVLLGRSSAVLASTGADGAIRYWNTHTGGELRSVTMKEGEGRLDLFAAPDGRLLAHFSLDGKYSEYALDDVATGSRICRTQTYASERFALAPDGKTVVVNRAHWVHPRKRSTDKKEDYLTPGRVADDLLFIELSSGSVVAEVPSGHRGGVRCLEFSPDGNTLASGGEDTSVLLWDWRRVTGLSRETAADIGDKERESLWADLASTDARKAYRAIGGLISCGDKSVSLLRKHLPPMAAAERDSWRKRLAELDDREFAVREKATQELTKLGVEAYFFLCRAAAEKVPLEVRRRLEQILASPEMKHPSTLSLRTIRVVQVLEAIATPAARELLADWSRGDTEAWLTQEAKAALQHLRR